MSKNRKIAAHQIISPDFGVIKNGVLTFDPNGVLLGVESDMPRIDSLSGVEFYSGTIIPGMVNAHTHLELSYLKDKIAPHTGLTGFVAEITAKRNYASTEEIYACADYQNSVMYSEGVAAVGDISNSSITFELKKRSKINYHTFIEQFGLGDAKFNISLVERARDMGINNSLTPHSTYSLSDALFKNIIAYGNGARLSIHFMESSAESLLFMGEGALAERFIGLGLNVDFAHYGSPARRLVDSIPPETPLLLIHNTFVTQSDIDLIMKHFIDVVWVVCPRSNEYIESTKPPLELLRSNGCRIAIGTDSLASNRSLLIIDEIRYVASNYDIPMHEIISWATINGAEALGMANILGSFELGKSPGAILLDSVDLKKVASGRRIV